MFSIVIKTIVIFLFFTVSAYAANIKSLKAYDHANILINHTTVHVAIARTIAQQATGLSVIDELQDDEGMFFIMEKNDYVSFWMKNMKINIDIIFIDQNGVVRTIDHNLPPCGITCPIHQPNMKIKYVLETRAGFAKRHHVVENKLIIRW